MCCMELSSGTWNKVADPVGWECGGGGGFALPAHRQRYAAPCRGGQALRIISNGRNWPLQAPAHGPAGRASGPRLRLDNAERLIEAFEDATADTHSVGDTQACAGSTVKDRC